ncbi:MAG: GtrA family protein [Candidatus Competibacter sp.]|nr:GtrA family protein [Candidatus Competibacter sp.]
MKTKLVSTGFKVFDRIGTFSRYLVTGGLLFLIDLAVFLALVRLGGFEPALAQPIGRATGAIAGFFGHRYITFFQNRDNPRHDIVVQGSGYLAVSVAMLLITPFVLLFFLYISGGDLVAAKVLTEIFAVIAVYLSLRFVFAAKEG